MRNLVNNFLLPLCILLLSGYSQAYGNVTKCNIAGNEPTESLQSIVDEARQNLTFIRTTSSSEFNHDLIAELTETSEEEEDFTPTFEWVEAHNYIHTIFFALLYGYLFKNIRRTFLIGKRTPYFSSFSPLYLAFRVIRL